MPNKLYAILGIALCGGCTLYKTGARNLINEPVDYIHQQQLAHGLRKEGRDAWRAFSVDHPEWLPGGDFECGFIDGFADYLDNGGEGDPPAIPPKRYRSNKYLNPEGFQAIDRYFAGFFVGSRAAIDSGLRDTLVVPVMIPARVDYPPPRFPESGPTLPPSGGIYRPEVEKVRPMSPVIELPPPRLSPEGL